MVVVTVVQVVAEVATAVLVLTIKIVLVGAYCAQQ